MFADALVSRYVTMTQGPTRKPVRESYLLPKLRDGKGDETLDTIENHAGDSSGTSLRN